MRRFALLFLLALPAPALAAPIDPAPPGPPWESLSSRQVAEQAGPRVDVRASDYAAFALDKPALRDDLVGARKEGAAHSTIVTIPAPDGTLQRFRAFDSPVLEPGAQKRFPSIRTYAAEGLDDPTATARFDVTAAGFHASVSSESGFWYVDPRFHRDQSVYMSYYRADLTDSRALLVEDQQELEEEIREAGRAPRRAPGDPVTKRTHRLAIANDPTYATFHGSTDLLVETAKATLVNRMNQVYNDDLAIRMVIVANDFLLNFDTTAQYNAQYSSTGCSGALITQNDNVIDAIIGSANYDVGHIVGGSAFNGGGIAGLGVVGTTSKGRGCTGLNPPVGDGFAIDYVAHEIGHQYGGNHTFDGNGNGNCSGNRAAAAAVEPGSGSSIQAYAGICGVENLQTNSDPYFSFRSVDEMLAHVATVPGAGTTTMVTNQSPIVTAPGNRTIPPQTPFTLSGSATDPDGDGLVYTWEQTNTGGAAGHPLLSNTKTDGPIFRLFSQAAITPNQTVSPAPGQNTAKEVDKTRSFPDPAQVAADNTNAETGTCPASDVVCFSEWLPTAAYPGPMNFRLTARDRDFTGGGLSVANTVISLSGTTPFAVTGPAVGSATGGDTTTVTWNVAGTTAAPFNVPNVRISYSTDGGLTFNYEIVASTANDGTEIVAIPNATTTQGRFKVEAVGNYFYDVSDGNLNVTVNGAIATPTPTPSPTASPTAAPTVDPVQPGVTSPTPTPSVTPTPTVTVTPSVTPTPTVTVTPSVTPTVTPSVTPTVTATVAASVTPTVTASTTPTVTASTTPTVTPGGGGGGGLPSPTPTRTPIPVVTPTVTPVFPTLAELAPDLALVGRKLKPDDKGKLQFSLRCKQLNAGSIPATCDGSVKITFDDGKKGKKGRASAVVTAASKKFSFGATQVGVIKVKLNRATRNLLRGGSLRALLTAQVGAQKASKQIKLKKLPS